jgi:hypothetical protein
MNSPSLHFVDTRRLMLLLAVTLLLGFNGCLPDAGPRGVVSQFLEAMEKKDMARAATLATPESKGMIDLIAKGSRLAGNSRMFEDVDPARVEIGNPKIEGDLATVPVKEKSSGIVFNYRLKKVNGMWKVSFDMSSLLKMTAGTVGEQFNRGIDSLKAGLEKLRDINFDTVANQLREGGKLLDSMQQAFQKELKEESLQ